MKACYNDLEIRLSENYYLLNKVLAEIGVTPEEFNDDLQSDRDLKIVMNRCLGTVQMSVLKQIFVANTLRLSAPVITRLLDSDLFKDTHYKKYEKGSDKVVDVSKDIVIQ